MNTLTSLFSLLSYIASPHFRRPSSLLALFYPDTSSLGECGLPFFSLFSPIPLSLACVNLVTNA